MTNRTEDATRCPSPLGSFPRAQWQPELHVGASIDANGNLTADGTRTFEWDARNQLLAVNAAQTTAFTYNGLKQRVAETVIDNSGTQSRIDVLWCEGQVCEERLTGGARRLFTHGQKTPTGDSFIAEDALGSIEVATSGSGVVTARYAYDPYGKQALIAGNDVAVGYAGHRRPIDASLSQTQYRFLDTSLGHWISEDPAGFVDGPNLYAYVGNNPTSRVDTSGLRQAGILRYLWNKFVGPDPIDEGIKRAWESCNAGTLIFAESPKIDPVAEPQRSGKARDDFYKRCLAGEREGYLRHVESMPITFGGLANMRSFSCCETCV